MKKSKTKEMKFAAYVKKYLGREITPVQMELFNYLKQQKHVHLRPASVSARAFKQYFSAVLDWFEKGYLWGYEKGKADAEDKGL